MKIKTRWNLLTAVVATGVVLASVRSAGAGVYRLAGDSMAPGLYVGDVVLVNKLAYDLRVPFTEKVLLGWSGPGRGEVVLVSVPAPDGGTMPAFKRVVGLSGDVVEIRDCRLRVNGRGAMYGPADSASCAASCPERKGTGVRSRRSPAVPILSFWPATEAATPSAPQSSPRGIIFSSETAGSIAGTPGTSDLWAGEQSMDGSRPFYPGWRRIVDEELIEPLIFPQDCRSPLLLWRSLDRPLDTP